MMTDEEIDKIINMSDDEFDEYYKDKCKKINEQIKPRPEFITELKSTLQDKVDQEKQRIEKRRKYLSKVAAIFITATVLTTGGVFADEIGDWLYNLFKNTDPSINVAIENGNIQNFDMDYVEKQGIGIKVNSIVIDEENINIILDVKGEIGENIRFDSFIFKGNDFEFDLNNMNFDNAMFDTTQKSIKNDEHIIIFTFSNFEKIEKINNVELFLGNLCIKKENNESVYINEKWELHI